MCAHLGQLNPRHITMEQSHHDDVTTRSPTSDAQRPPFVPPNEQEPSTSGTSQFEFTDAMTATLVNSESRPKQTMNEHTVMEQLVTEHGFRKIPAYSAAITNPILAAQLEKLDDDVFLPDVISALINATPVQPSFTRRTTTTILPDNISVVNIEVTPDIPDQMLDSPDQPVNEPQYRGPASYKAQMAAKANLLGVVSAQAEPFQFAPVQTGPQRRSMTADQPAKSDASTECTIYGRTTASDLTYTRFTSQLPPQTARMSTGGRISRLNKPYEMKIYTSNRPTTRDQATATDKSLNMNDYCANCCINLNGRTQRQLRKLHCTLRYQRQETEFALPTTFIQELQSAIHAVKEKWPEHKFIGANLDYAYVNLHCSMGFISNICGRAITPAARDYTSRRENELNAFTLRVPAAPLINPMLTEATMEDVSSVKFEMDRIYGLHDY